MFGRVGRIDGFDEEVLNVRIRGRQPPGDRIVLAEHGDRAPGKVAPLTDPSGVTTRAKYHRIGALRSRCGSLARIGRPLNVRDPPTTHLFDAPLPTPVKVPSSSSMLSLLA